MVDDEKWDYIHRYTRKQAIEDGVLYEVPDVVRTLVGLKYHTAVTEAVLRYVAKDDIATLVSVLQKMVVSVAENKTQSDTIYFSFSGEKLWALCGPGDDGITPVITVMRIDED
jgi:hypothetical protein